MSRVSRKKIGDENVVREKHFFYKTASYTRLSHENGSHRDPDSIEVQKLIIKEYLKDRGDFVLVSEYSDNGFTGTNFKRPGFEALMNEVRSGNINCVVVKDLSRFGRDFIETGNYIERIFPYLGIRFIAVNDGYDSVNPDCTSDYLLLALKNLMNDYYAKDISRKIQPVIHRKQEEGIFVGSIAPFGYSFGNDARKRFVIDRKVAPIVERIFQMYASGNAIISIVKNLNKERIPSPYAYAASSGILKIDWDSPIDRKLWNATTINRILQSPVYIGNMALRKSIRSLYDGMPVRVIPQEEWIIKENTHEPIIEKNVFEQVQEQLKDRKESSMVKFRGSRNLKQKETYKENLWRGKLFCGDCGKLMVKSKYWENNQVVFSYFCKVASDTENTVCQWRSIRESKLLHAVSSVIFTQIALALDMKQKIIQLNNSNKFLKNKKLAENEINKILSNIEEVNRLRVRIYEEYVSGVLTEADYFFAKNAYDCKKNFLEEELQKASNKKKSCNKGEMNQNKWLTLFQSYRNQKVLNKEMIQELIVKVTIYQHNRISITVRFQDELETLVKEMGERIRIMEGNL